jgi:hypothetical protein
MCQSEDLLKDEKNDGVRFGKILLFLQTKG